MYDDQLMMILTLVFAQTPKIQVNIIQIIIWNKKN